MASAPGGVTQDVGPGIGWGPRDNWMWSWAWRGLPTLSKGVAVGPSTAAFWRGDIGEELP